jgi:hypothetical protein
MSEIPRKIKGKNGIFNWVECILPQVVTAPRGCICFNDVFQNSTTYSIDAAAYFAERIAFCGRDSNSFRAIIL